MKKGDVARICKVGAFGTVVSGVCSLGLLGLLLGVFGSTFGQAMVDQYGDLVFYPSFGMFATLLIYGMLSLARNVVTYALTLGVLVFVLFLVRSWEGLLLVLPGIAIGLATTRFCTIPDIKKRHK